MIVRGKVIVLAASTAPPPPPPPPPVTSGPVGYATMDGETTGGGNLQPIIVNSLAELNAAATNPAPAVIWVYGNYSGSSNIWVESNKTIIGKDGATLTGVGLSIYGKSNIIVQNLKINKVVGADCVTIKEMSHHVWVDHCEFWGDRDNGWDYYDELLEVTDRSSYVTVSNCIFRDHHMGILIGSGDLQTTDIGYLKVTICGCYFFNISERGPRARFGFVHVFNNYYLNDNTGYNTGYAIGAAMDVTVRTDNNHFENQYYAITTDLNSDPGFISGANTNINTNPTNPNFISTAESNWLPPYEYASILLPAANVKSSVLANAGVQSEQPTPVGDEIVVTVKFASAPTAATSQYTNLKYGKHGMINIEWDDASPGAMAALPIMQAKTFTDGAGNNKPYTLAVAVNGHHHWANAVIGTDPALGMTYAQMQQVIDAGGDIENHSDYHDPYGTAGRNYPDHYISPFDMMKNLDNDFYAAMNYRMNAMVVPTDYIGYMTAAKDLGYAVGSSTGTFDDLQPYPPYTNVGSLNDIPAGTNYLPLRRDFTDTWDSSLAALKTNIDSLLSGISETVNKFYRVGSHNLDAQASFQQLMDYLSTQANDKLWVTTMREFAEYRLTKSLTVKTEQLVGNILTITLDQSAISNRVRWKDLSLKISSDTAITSVTVTGADSSSYNTSSKLINVFKENLTFGAVEQPPADGDPLYLTANESNRVSGDIPLQTKDIYRLTTPVGESGALIDNVASTTAEPGDDNTINPQKTYIQLRKYRSEVANVRVRGYNSGAKYYLVKWPTWTKTQITNISAPVDGWVTLTPATVDKCTYLIIEHSAGQLPSDIKINGTYIPYTEPTPVVRTKKPFKRYIGNNIFFWDSTPNNDQNNIEESRYALVNLNYVVRDYIDHHWINHAPGLYSFAPTKDGNWNLDVIYTRLKADGKIILGCIKSAPTFIVDTYPTDLNGENLQHFENIPAPWINGETEAERQARLETPEPFRVKAETMFQYVARYGSNPNVPADLVKVFTAADGAQTWEVNTKRIGLNLVDCVEAGNEEDKWWRWPYPPKAYQSGRVHAALMSACYDGHKGTMGNNVGAKTADPNMKVSFAALAHPSVDYIKGIVDWCREYRGYNPDGTVNLCFDVVNFHHYSNDGGAAQHSGNTTRGMRPELTSLKSAAQKILDYVDTELGGMEVWQTESGFDISEFSNQRAARPIDTPANSTEETRKKIQAEWSVALAMLYWSIGVDYFAFYSLRDTDVGDEWNQYARSGWDDLVGAENSGVYQWRPIANVFAQLKAFFYEYTHQQTISTDPLIYKATNPNGDIIYALVIPDEQARVANYDLVLPNGFSNVRVWELDGTTSTPNVKVYAAPGGVKTIPVTEMYIFVQPTNDAVTTTDPLKKVSGISFNLQAYKLESDADFTLNATSNNDESPITYTSSNPAIASVSGNLVSINGPGSVILTANQAASTNYRAAEPKPVELLIINEDGETPVTSVLIAGGFVRSGNNYSLQAYTPGWNTTAVFNVNIPAGQSGYIQMICPADGINTGALGLDPTTTAGGPNDFDFVIWMNSQNKVECKYAGTWLGTTPIVGVSVVRLRVDATNAYYEYSTDGGTVFTQIATKPRPNVDLYGKAWGTTPEQLTDVRFKLI